MADFECEPSLESDVAAVREILSGSCPSSTPWTEPCLASRRVYSRSFLLSLRDDRLHPLPPSDPVRRSQPSLPCLPDSMPALESTRTADVLLSGSDAVVTFSDLALPSPILRALTRQDLHRPSPVQLRALPVARLGADVIVQAKSGTGKTLVFSIVAAEAAVTASAAQGPAALLLAPTRELAVQTARVAERLCEEFPSRPQVALFIGGRPERHDKARLSKQPPGIVVATPGRALALVEAGSLRVEGLKVLALDEADRLLDGSLGDVVPRLCALLPMRKQTLAFSATYPSRLQRLLQVVMRSPTHIQLSEESTSGEEGGGGELPAKSDLVMSANRKAVLIGVRQRKVLVDDFLAPVEDIVAAKIAALTALVQQNPFSFCIVFINDKKHGRNVTNQLRANGFASMHIHANIRQSDRSVVMQLVEQGKLQVLVSTDLLARGVDIESCDLVVHLDIPVDAATYLHRVGRAGRFGKLGLSVILYLGSEEGANLRSLERSLGFCMQEMRIPSTLEYDRRSFALPTAKGVPNDQCNEKGKVNRSLKDRVLGPQHSDNVISSSDDGSILESSILETAVSPATKVRKTSDQRISWKENSGSQRKRGGGEDFEDSYDDALKLTSVMEMEPVDECIRNESEPQQKTNKKRAVDRNICEMWDTYAHRAYDEGYREAYLRAFRMGRQLRERLLGPDD